MEGIVVIDQINNSKLYCVLRIFYLLWLIESKKPTTKDLNRYVARKFASDWEDIGIELGLDLDVLKIIARDNPQRSEACLRETLDKWLKLNTDATWEILEVALTNVNRTKLGLEPVDDIYGEVMY